MNYYPCTRIISALTSACDDDGLDWFIGLNDTARNIDAGGLDLPTNYGQLRGTPLLGC